MELLYREEHLTCLHYDNNPGPAIELKEITGGLVLNKHPRRNIIVFLLEGELAYMRDGFPPGRMEKGRMLLLPPEKQTGFAAVQRAKVLIIRLNNEIRFCECYLEGNLLRETAGTEGQHQEPFTLRMNPAMEAYVESLLLCLEKGLKCEYYFSTKIRELFYLFRAFYTKRELALFFQDVLETDSYFFYFVKRNHRDHGTVTGLATAMNMSLQSFEKQFKTVFGMPAYQWMIQQKAGDIYNALCSGQIPLKELAYRFGFASKSSFSDFVRKNLGTPPGEIRKNTCLNKNDEQKHQNE
ncbi:MAG: helix-turn-helix domain-containing protein [Tannerellaceae bacterium]|jgi:AraC-like DNA-binding protein|nr:helix-turn-helix domain-containing protein [Tannerellaceae bacterium]